MIDKIYKIVCGYHNINNKLDYWENEIIYNIDKETDKLFICTEENRKINKKKLGVIDSDFNITPKLIKLYTYCLEENIEESKRMLKQQIVKEIKNFKETIDTACKYFNIE